VSRSAALGRTASAPQTQAHSHWIAASSGVRLHARVAGDGPPVILLHGFPEYWYAFRHQLAPLAAAGFRAIALDMRGYNASGRPQGIDDYRIELLMRDVADVIHHFGSESAYVVGHDWGGLVAWCVASQQPELVRKLAILNSPHPHIWLREIKRLRQLRRSWPMLILPLPLLPELLFKSRWLVRQLFRSMALNPDCFSARDLEALVSAIQQPGAARAALHYYRASVRHPLPARQITVPTLVIWGTRDRLLQDGLLDGLDCFVPHLNVMRVIAGHCVQEDAPEQVTRALLDFFGQPPSA
jgi:epoxide hydrolase 4